MRYYSWKRFLVALLLRPHLFLAFLKLPRSYTSLDQWLEIDGIKCTIAARAVGCRCPASLWEQQQMNMEFRRSVSNSFNSWMNKIRADPSAGDPIAHISDDFKQQKKCHRRYRSPGAGVYCYCNTHKH